MSAMQLELMNNITTKQNNQQTRHIGDGFIVSVRPSTEMNHEQLCQSIYFWKKKSLAYRIHKASYCIIVMELWWIK